MLIGILEDDPAQAKLLRSWLETAGHQVKHAASGDEFLSVYKQHALDLAILDWQVPDKTGLEVLSVLRTQYECQIPILFSTQRDTEADIVTALQTGADDYLAKPIRQAELLARIAALGRRAGITETSAVMTFGPLVIDTQQQTISCNGELVKLTRKDYLVALCLFQNLGKVLSREYLLKAVWGIDTGLDTRTVDVHVSRVRRALKLGPQLGYGVKNIYQHGYRLLHLDA